MKSQQFLRIVEEICIILKIHQPSIHKVIQFYQQFQKSQTHKYRTEIIIAVCIFLASKIDENQHKIRDIVNVCYLITSLYKLMNKRKGTQGIEYINMDFLKQELGDKKSEIWKQLIPDFPLERFNELKKEILQAEQHLLRIINFEVDNTRLEGYKVLAGCMQKFKFNQCLRQLVIKIYNDSIFADAPESPKACIHFAIQFAIRSKLVPEEDILSCLLEKEWWQNEMNMKQDDLLDYGQK